ncbi:Valine--tRNA ligase [Alphaproteobacteria bacterium]
MLQNLDYDHSSIEGKWQNYWQTASVYSWNSDRPRDETFVIDTPPPGISGLLHMGHIFSYTHTDFIARFQRMRGKTVFYPMGFDDNGLPTERLVEKVKGVKAAQVPRTEFARLCEEVVAESEEEFRNLFKSIALSVDWKQEYQTISERSRTISQMSFLDLYYKGYIKRQNAPTFWDPIDMTAIAQAEIEDRVRKGTTNDIIFETISGEKIIVSTTRPELIPACVALFYHPNDKRHQYLQGQIAITPIFGKQVPIIPDVDVDLEKGSGIVMCCTFGDIQDIHWWRRHNLPIIDCIDIHGKMKKADFLNDMKVFDARKAVLSELSRQRILLGQIEITQSVKCAERSGAPLEILVTEQWYISVLEHRKAIFDKVNECNWYPSYMKVRMDNWVNGLNQDWCISRQRYFGVPFPVWYSKRVGEEGKILLPTVDQLPVNPLVDLPKGYTREEIEPDKDVMDTWATSSISPQLSSLGISKDFSLDEQKHKKLFPFDLRPQAHDIIRTWAFSTIVKALYHENIIPWKNLMISGWCLGADKVKMSKSRGNVVTPRELIIEKGADIVRYWASTSKLGMDTAYSEEMFKIGRKLIVKLWNACKFCGIHIKNLPTHVHSPLTDHKLGKITANLDIWALSMLKEAIEESTAALEIFEYCDARTVIEKFFWNVLCDNYFELVKGRLYTNINEVSGQSAVITLYHCLEHLLRLFAPFIPHVTEELYFQLFGGNEYPYRSIHNCGMWPKLDEQLYDKSICTEGEVVVRLLELVRKFKSLRNISLRKEVVLVEIYSESNISPSALSDLKNTSNAKDVVLIHTSVKDIGNKLEVAENILVSECQTCAVQVIML